MQLQYFDSHLRSNIYTFFPLPPLQAPLKGTFEEGASDLAPRTYRYPPFSSVVSFRLLYFNLSSHCAPPDNDLHLTSLHDTMVSSRLLPLTSPGLRFPSSHQLSCPSAPPYNGLHFTSLCKPPCAPPYNDLPSTSLFQFPPILRSTIQWSPFSFSI